MAEGDVQVAFVPDLGELEAAYKRAESFVQGLARSASQASKAMASEAAGTTQEVVQLTAAEKALAAQVRRLKDEQVAAANQLGITRSEYKRLQKELAAQTQAEVLARDVGSRLTDTQKELAAQLVTERTERKQLASALGLNLTELKKLQKAEAEYIAGQERMAASGLSVEEALNRSRVQIERQAQGLDIGTGRARSYHDTLALVADTTGELDSTLKGLGGALGVADASMDKALGTAGELFGGLEAVARLAKLAGVEIGGVAAAVGSMAAAVGLGAAGMIAFAGEVTASGPPLAELRESLKKAEERLEAAKERAVALKDELAELRSGEEDLELQLAVSNGQLSEREAQTIRTVNTIKAKYGEQIAASQELIAAQQAERAALEEELRSGRLSLEQRAKKVAQTDELRKSIDDERLALAGLKDEQTRQVALANEVSAAKERGERAAQAQKDAEDAAIKATRELTSVTKEADKAISSLARQQEQLAAAFEESFLQDYLAGLDQALFGTEQLSRSEAKVRDLVAATDELIPLETLDRADQLRLLLLQLETEGARAGVTLETALASDAFERSPLESSLVRINDELLTMEEQAAFNEEAFVGALDAMADATHAFTALYRSGLQEQVDADRARLAAIKGMQDEESKAERKMLRQSIRERKKAAKAAFVADQVASIAQAVIAGVLAAQKALTLGPIAGPIAAAAIGVTAAVNVAAIANQEPPSLRVGGRITREANDSTAVPVIAHQGEHVVNSLGVAAAGGHEALDGLNRGEPLGGGGVQQINLVVNGETTQAVFIDGATKTPKGRQMTQGLRGRGRGNAFEAGRL